MSPHIRSYVPEDYDQVIELHRQTELFGGHFDDNRDSSEKLKKRIEADPNSILVAVINNKIVGTVSIIEDGRVAWLFRFAVKKSAGSKVADKALSILESRGHKQVLVYPALGNKSLDQRYQDLGFNRGSDYTCFWKDI